MENQIWDTSRIEQTAGNILRDKVELIRGNPAGRNGYS